MSTTPIESLTAQLKTARAQRDLLGRYITNFPTMGSHESFEAFELACFCRGLDPKEAKDTGFDCPKRMPSLSDWEQA